MKGPAYQGGQRLGFSAPVLKCSPITALISCNRQLGLVGLQLRILNGVVSLLTTEVHNKALAAYVSEQSGASGNLQMTIAS
jgi:hypothetical protein